MVPSALISEMPERAACRWLTYEDVEEMGIRVDAMVADLGPDLTEGQVAALAGAAIAGVPVLDRRYMVETMTGRTPLGGLTPNEFGALLPSRQYLVVRRGLELLLTVLVLPVLAADPGCRRAWWCGSTVRGRSSSCRSGSAGAAASSA